MTNHNIQDFAGKPSIETDDFIYVRTTDRPAAIKFFKKMGIKDPRGVTYEGPTHRGGLFVYACPVEQPEPEPTVIADYIIQGKMDEAEEKAWKALAGYKFWMAGYHMAAWVKYNQLFDHSDRRPNPFLRAVKLARTILKERDNSVRNITGG